MYYIQKKSDRKPREATAADIFTRNELLATMQLAVVFTAALVALAFPLVIAVLLRQTVVVAVVELVLTHVTDTRLAQQ